MPNIESLPLAELKPWPRNARTHSKKQVRQLMASMKRFGFTQPVLIDEDNHILAGHGRVCAARELSFAEVPCLRIAHLSRAEKRAYVLADNKLALNAGWDQALLGQELKDLLAEDAVFDLGVTGFSLAETKRLIEPETGQRSSPQQEQPTAPPPPQRCQPGDIFELGPHWLICRDELDFATVSKLLEEESPKLLITMPRDKHRLPAAEEAKLAEATLMASERAGANIFLAEGDPLRCDEIMRRWQSETGAGVYWFYPGALAAHPGKAEDFGDGAALPKS